MAPTPGLQHTASPPLPPVPRAPGTAPPWQQGMRRVLGDQDSPGSNSSSWKREQRAWYSQLFSGPVAGRGPQHTLSLMPERAEGGRVTGVVGAAGPRAWGSGGCLTVHHVGLLHVPLGASTLPTGSSRLGTHDCHLQGRRDEGDPPLRTLAPPPPCRQPAHLLTLPVEVHKRVAGLGHVWHSHALVYPVHVQVQPSRAIQPQAQDGALRTRVQIGPELLTDLGSGDGDLLSSQSSDHRWWPPLGSAPLPAAGAWAMPPRSPPAQALPANCRPPTARLPTART